MAIPSIANVEITDTFQVWINTTNTLVDVAKNKALTASLAGDTTTGDATLIGSFTANTVIAFDLLRSDTFSSKSGGSTPISITSPLAVSTGAIQTSQSLTSTLGPRSAYNSAVTTWNIGFENTTTNSFIISTSTAVTPTVRITTAGEVIATKFTGQVDGVSATATKLATARTISASGDINWSVIFDGAQNVSSAATIANNSVTSSKFRQSAALSIVGNATNALSNVSDITAGIDGQVLRRSGSAVGFGSINLTSSAAVTGALPITNGGTGASSFGASTIPFSTGTSLTSSPLLVWFDSNGGPALGVGTGAPAFTLDVNGTMRVTGTSTLSALNAAATTITSLTTTGQAFIGSTLQVLGSISANNNITAFTSVTASDIKLKENVVTIDSALDIIESLRGVTFDWKDKNIGGKTYGLIAQEVEKVIPELVYDNGEFKGVAYANLVSVLIEAVKELRSEVKALKG